MNDTYYKPDYPFLLSYIDKNECVRHTWCKTMDALIKTVDEIKSYGWKILKAIEVEKCRDVDIK